MTEGWNSKKFLLRMLLLNSKPLSKRAIDHLKAMQAKIDVSTNPTKRAKDAWENGKKLGAFEDIRKILMDMCVGTGICNYCENNEATDIEHIYPKSFFPNRAFVWENYLLACKTCNSHYKLDKIAVFNPAGSTTRFDVVRGTLPPTQEVLMINPRTENPLDFWELNLRTGVFLESPPAATREFIKAAYTLEVLALNDRDALREAREARAKYLFQKLNTAVLIYEAADFTVLDSIVNSTEPFISINQAPSLQKEKDKLLQSIKKAIGSGPHPTVWEEIKRQQLNFPKFTALFARIPQALTW